MGMYDDVNYECTCCVCHSKVDGFQSKNADCNLDMIHPLSVDDFYTSCKKCGCWVDFERIEDSDYKKTTFGKDNKKLKTKTVKIKSEPWLKGLYRFNEPEA